MRPGSVRITCVSFLSVLYLLFLLLPWFLSYVHSSLPPSFSEFERTFSEQRSAKEKFDDIWRMLTTTGSSLPSYPSIFNFLRDLNLLPLLSGQNLRLLTSTSMFRPWVNDHKMLHTQPAYASVKFVFNEEAHRHYTGLFQADSVDYGLMSMSPGFKVPNLTNFFAFNIRSFRDSAPATSLIAAFNLVSVPNWNVFDYMVCTHYNWLMALPLALLGPTRAGQGWTQYFNQFGISNLAEYNLTGERLLNPKFPWTLCFIPNETLRRKSSGHRATNSAYDLMRVVRAGDKMYDVWAIKEPYPLADPATLKRFSHQIGELFATSEFLTSTYGAQRLLGTHQRFEEDLTYRPDWIPFASPFYLMRAGSVGVYSGLFPVPNPDIERAELNLLLAVSGIIKSFSTVEGFIQFLQQFGLTPIQLYQSTVEYVTKVVLPLRLNPRTRMTITPPFKLSLQWASSMIRTIALYVSRVGLHPPLGPLQLEQLGNRHVENAEDAIRLIDLVRERGRLQSIDQTTLCTVGLNGTTCSPSSASQFNGTTTEGVKDFMDPVEETVFKHVRLLPFHLDAFNLVRTHSARH